MKPLPHLLDLQLPAHLPLPGPTRYLHLPEVGQGPAQGPGVPAVVGHIERTDGARVWPHVIPGGPTGGPS